MLRPIFVFFSILFALPIYGVEPVDLPVEIEPFVLEDYFAIAYVSGDLNGDKRPDGILVLQFDGEDKEAERPLLILIRAADGSLSVAKRNDKAVFCEGCGGMMGDPFVHITIGANKFSVVHYGGSAWRWSDEATFAYSRRDNTWQLTLVEITSFHASDPDNAEKTTRTPPRDFGKIDIADYDPENYLGKGFDSTRKQQRKQKN